MSKLRQLSPSLDDWRDNHGVIGSYIPRPVNRQAQVLSSIAVIARILEERACVMWIDALRKV